MDKTRALAIRDKLVDLCRQHDIWHEVTYENRPKLGKIKIEISIKVDNNLDMEKSLG